jgi:hypothetical protein
MSFCIIKYHKWRIYHYTVRFSLLAGHQPVSAQSSVSSSGDSKGTGPRIKAKKSRGVGISAEPQTLQNLKVILSWIRIDYLNLN